MPFLYIREPIFLVSYGMWSKGGENKGPNGQSNRHIAKQNFFSFYWTLSPLGAAAQRAIKGNR